MGSIGVAFGLGTYATVAVTAASLSVLCRPPPAPPRLAGVASLAEGSTLARPRMARARLKPVPAESMRMPPPLPAPSPPVAVAVLLEGAPIVAAVMTGGSARR